MKEGEARSSSISVGQKNIKGWKVYRSFWATSAFYNGDWLKQRPPPRLDLRQRRCEAMYP